MERKYLSHYYYFIAKKYKWDLTADDFKQTSSDPMEQLRILEEMTAIPKFNNVINSFSNFIHFVNDLDEYELEDLLEDILLDNQHIFGSIISSARDLTSGEIAFDWLLDLPHNTQCKINERLENIYFKALRGDYNDKKAMVLRRIHAIVIRNKEGLSENFIKDVLESRSMKIDPIHRMQLLVVLANLKETAGQIFWDSLEPSKDIFALPALLAYYTEKKAFRDALKLLVSVNVPKNNISEECFRYIQSRIESAFYLYVKSLGGDQAFLESDIFLLNLSKSISPWAKVILVDVFNLPTFSGYYTRLPKFYQFTHTEYKPIISSQTNLAYELFQAISYGSLTAEQVFSQYAWDKKLLKEILRLIIDASHYAGGDITSYQGDYIDCYQDTISDPSLNRLRVSDEANILRRDGESSKKAILAYMKT